MAVIGECFADARFIDLLVESVVLGLGLIDLVIEDKIYNVDTRGL